MNHAERLEVIIRNLEIGLETGDMVDAIDGSVDALEQIREEMLAKDEVSG